MTQPQSVHLLLSLKAAAVLDHAVSLAMVQNENEDENNILTLIREDIRAQMPQEAKPKKIRKKK